MLKSEETWQVWSKEQTLSDFYPDRSKIRLTFILDSYFGVLKDEIQDFTSQLNSYHDNVKTSMASIETELESYLKEAEINEDFLRFLLFYLLFFVLIIFLFYYKIKINKVLIMFITI